MKGDKSKAKIMKGDKSKAIADDNEKKEDPAAPKAPIKPVMPASAFIVFMEKYRRDNGEKLKIGKDGATAWLAMNKEEKAPYAEEEHKRLAAYKKKLEHYEKQMEAYKKELEDYENQMENKDGNGNVS